MVADPREGGADAAGVDPVPDASEAMVEPLLCGLDELVGELDAPGAKETARDVQRLLAAAGERGLIDSRVRELRASDVVEALVGSIVFATPLLVEGGVFGIADHLAARHAFGLPVFLVANLAFTAVMTFALLEWTGRHREDVQVLFGRIPVRVPVILVVSFLVATSLMAVWGRLGSGQSPTEAFARVTVVWTVGALGAALGDLLAGDGRSRLDASGSTDASTDVDADEGAPTSADVDDFDRLEAISDGQVIGAIHGQFDELETAVRSDELRREVERLQAVAMAATTEPGFGDRIRKYTRRDIAEAFVGSIFFAIPLLVEDGVFEVADFFVAVRVGGLPVLFGVHALFVVAMVGLLVYWAGPQDVQVARPILGIVPRRLVGISVVSFLTAAALMTMWGRVGGWSDPAVALARIGVVWTVAAFGAALGDILPGESSGEDINEDLAELGELVGMDQDGP